MSCDYRIPECSCGSRVNSTCVDYEGNLPECSTIHTTGSRINIQQVVEDLYSTVCTLRSEVDISDLDLKCVGDVKTLKLLLGSIINKICTLEGLVNNTKEFDDCHLDYGDLVDRCGTTLKVENQCEFNQFILDKLNELIRNA